MVAVVAGLYWCALFLPVYIEHWEISDAVQSAFNSHGIVNNYVMRSELEGKLRELKFVTHKEVDPMTGNEVDRPGLAVNETNPNIIIDDVSRILTIRYEYDRTIHLVPTEKIKVLHFVAQKKGKFPH